MFFAQQPPRSAPPSHAAVMNAVNIPIFSLPNNCSSQFPCSIRISSAKQIAHFLQFVELCGATIWSPTSNPVARLHIRIEDSDFYDYFL